MMTDPTMKHPMDHMEIPTPTTAESTTRVTAADNSTMTTMLDSKYELPPGMDDQFQHMDYARSATMVSGSNSGWPTVDPNFGVSICAADYAKEFLREKEKLENQRWEEELRLSKYTPDSAQPQEAPSSQLQPDPQSEQGSEPKPRQLQGAIVCLAAVVLLIVATLGTVAAVVLSQDSISDSPPPTTSTTSKGTSPTPAPTEGTNHTTTAPTSSDIYSHEIVLLGPYDLSKRPTTDLLTFTSPIGYTDSFWVYYNYDATEFSFIRNYNTDGDNHMKETANTTIISIEGQNVTVNTNLHVEFLNREFAANLGAEQHCYLSWTLNFLLGSPNVSYASDVQQCNMGNAGMLTYDWGSRVS